jgi:hypothetical protein
MKLLFSVTLLVAVASVAIAGKRSDVFAHPKQYVGKTVTVCGYVEDRSEDRNIWVDRAHSDVHAMGMAILGHAPLTSWDGARACITGKVFETHCKDDKVCLDTGFEYGITVSNVGPAN